MSLHKYVSLYLLGKTRKSTLNVQKSITRIGLKHRKRQLSISPKHFYCFYLTIFGSIDCTHKGWFWRGILYVEAGVFFSSYFLYFRYSNCLQNILTTITQMPLNSSFGQKKEIGNNGTCFISWLHLEFVESLMIHSKLKKEFSFIHESRKLASLFFALYVNNRNSTYVTEGKLEKSVSLNFLW